MKRSSFCYLAAAAAAVILNPVGAMAGHNPPAGASEVVTPVGGAGYPEGIAVKGNRFYVSGPAAFGLPLGSAYVNAYDVKSGALEESYPITITNPNAGMSGASCAAFGPDGKLYVVEPFVGIIRMELGHKNKQTVYAPFMPQGPSLLNDLAFDDDGNLYVTDSFAATIYRIPAGGGAPVAWFTDARLAGDPMVPFGVNGIRIDRDNANVYVSVTAENLSLNGVIYKLPLVANPAPMMLQEFHRYTPDMNGLPAPDGIAFGKTGKLYVALAGSSQISVLAADGTEEARYSGPAANPGGALDPLPWANPANIAFDKKGSILVTNHASLVPYDPNLFAVFSVFVNDKGQPLP